MTNPNKFYNVYKVLIEEQKRQKEYMKIQEVEKLLKYLIQKLKHK
jgi:hypothetical protein